MSIVFIQKILGNFSFFVLLFLMILYAFGSIYPSGNLQLTGTFGLILTNISLLVVLMCRWIETGHYPLSNLYESLLFLSWSLTTVPLVIQFYTKDLGFDGRGFDGHPLDGQGWPSNPRPSRGFVSFLQSTGGLNLSQPSSCQSVKWKANRNYFLNGTTCVLALLVNGFATFTLPVELQKETALVPSLQSNWLIMHVTVMMASYATLMIGSLLAFFVLLTSDRVESLSNSFDSLSQPKNMYLGTVKENFSDEPFFSLKRKDSAEILDNLSYRTLGVGFPLLTIGILSGAVWANQAWGSYWSWDPKETWAFITWLVFAIYFHTRLSKGWAGKKSAFVACIGFVTVWVCYLGVNLLGKGLHTYGWWSNTNIL